MLLGVSAGSMNSAERVYALPEEEGEAVEWLYRLIKEPSECGEDMCWAIRCSCGILHLKQ